MSPIKIVRVPCVKCDLFGHDPTLRLCSLCRLDVQARLKKGHTARQISGDNAPLFFETRKLATALAVAAAKATPAARDASTSLRPLPREASR